MARILIADDTELSRDSIGAVLECFGHEVVEVRNGIECLEALRSSPCDLLITDIDMPQVNGIEVIFSLKNLLPKLPVIAISGFDRLYGREPLSLAKSAGADEVLHKPFRAQDLMHSVDRALGVVPPKVAFG